MTIDLGLHPRSTGHLRCGLCHEELKGSSSVSVCPGCGAARHEACLAELGDGSCGTLGCERARPGAVRGLAPQHLANPETWWPEARSHDDRPVLPRCSLCRECLTPSTTVYVCPACDVGWHRGCVVERGTGTCVTPGCERRGVERRLEASRIVRRSPPVQTNRAYRPPVLAAAPLPPFLRAEPHEGPQPLWFKLMFAVSCIALIVGGRACWVEKNQGWHEGMWDERVLGLAGLGLFALGCFTAVCGVMILAGELDDSSPRV